MKIIRAKDIKTEPASHEDPNNPGVVKKVLFRLGDLAGGNIQMINWATLLPHKSFRAHAHRDMQEIFILMNGNAELIVDGKKILLQSGDACVVLQGELHEMKNPSANPLTFLAIGIAPLGK